MGIPDDPQPQELEGGHSQMLLGMRLGVTCVVSAAFLHVLQAAPRENEFGPCLEHWESLTDTQNCPVALIPWSTLPKCLQPLGRSRHVLYNFLDSNQCQITLKCPTSRHCADGPGKFCSHTTGTPLTRSRGRMRSGRRQWLRVGRRFTLAAPTRALFAIPQVTSTSSQTIPHKPSLQKHPCWRKRRSTDRIHIH